MNFVVEARVIQVHKRSRGFLICQRDARTLLRLFVATVRGRPTALSTNNYLYHLVLQLV